LELNPPITAARLKDTHRLIPSRYPPTGILDLIASPKDFEAVAELEGWTNDRISAELGVLSILPAGEWILGRANATAIMAAYCHPNEAGGRFSSRDRGAWYAALSLETAIRETVFHRTKEIAESGILETSVQMRQYLADFETELHDVRASPDFDACHEPDSYVVGQQLGATLLENGSNGIWYRSVRNPGGECIVCFRPALVTNVRTGAHFEYRWEGHPEPKVTQIGAG
jgi:RES domain-containing protein